MPEYLLPVVSEGLSDAVIENALAVGFPAFLTQGIERLETENPRLYNAVLEMMDTPTRKPHTVRVEILAAVVLTHELLQRQLEAEDLNERFGISPD